jgi:hypothetical protein
MNMHKIKKTQPIEDLTHRRNNKMNGMKDVGSKTKYLAMITMGYS